MEPSGTPNKQREAAGFSLRSLLLPRAWRARTVGCALMAAVVCWDTSAYAFNAIISQDLPILTQMAATELASYAELGSILGEMVALVKSAKEYTTVAKTAWGALNELRHMSLSQLRDAAMTGLQKAFPELGEMYGDIRDIGDLKYRDYRAFATLRGMLWEEVYGPAIDYMHTGHGNLDALAGMQEHRYRMLATIEGRRAEAEGWEKDCRDTASQGEGACQAAASRAEIQQALQLAGIHATSLQILDAQERQIKRADRAEADGIYAFDRWLFDLERYISAASPNAAAGHGAYAGETCLAGQCLYEQYGLRMQQRLQVFRARHQSGLAGAPAVPASGVGSSGGGDSPPDVTSPQSADDPSRGG